VISTFHIGLGWWRGWGLVWNLGLGWVVLVSNWLLLGWRPPKLEVVDGWIGIVRDVECSMVIVRVGGYGS